MPGAPTTTNIDGQGPEGEVEPEPAPPAWETERLAGVWAVVEIMGHTVRAGSISDATIGGAVMLRIQHPSVRDHEGLEPLTEYYSPGALFSVRPVSRASATQWAENRWRASRPAPALAELQAAADTYIDDDDDRDEDEF